MKLSSPLCLGMSSQQVIKLQTRLIELSLLDEGSDTGVFSKATRAAVMKFQTANNLEIDGVVGNKTADILWGSKSPSPDEDLTKGYELIREFESLRLSAYSDPRTEDKPITIGYGSTYKLDGSEWSLSDVITEEEALELLKEQVKQSFLPHLQKIPYWNEMNNNQKGALLSFAWDLGVHFYGTPGFNTISRALVEKRWHDVPNAMKLYCNSGRNIEGDLSNRRTAEGELFSQTC